MPEKDDRKAIMVWHGWYMEWNKWVECSEALEDLEDFFNAEVAKVLRG